MSQLSPFVSAFRALSAGFTVEAQEAEKVGDSQRDEGKENQAVESYLLAGKLFRFAGAYDRASKNLEQQIAADLSRVGRHDQNLMCDQ